MRLIENGQINTFITYKHVLLCFRFFFALFHSSCLFLFFFLSFFPFKSLFFSSSTLIYYNLLAREKRNLTKKTFWLRDYLLERSNILCMEIEYQITVIDIYILEDTPCSGSSLLLWFSSSAESVGDGSWRRWGEPSSNPERSDPKISASWFSLHLDFVFSF